MSDKDTIPDVIYVDGPDFEEGNALDWVTNPPIDADDDIFTEKYYHDRIVTALQTDLAAHKERISELEAQLWDMHRNEDRHKKALREAAKLLSGHKFDSEHGYGLIIKTPDRKKWYDRATNWTGHALLDNSEEEDG